MKQRLAILSFQIDASGKPFRLLPAGKFRAADGSGRPGDVEAWYIDADLARQVIARAQARADRKVIDYEHQTLKAAENGQPAPAAGWIEAMEWRDPAADEPGGLYVTPRWTARAAAMIEAEEYRYISPVFSYDKQGRVLEVLHAALVNFAGLDGLTDLAALSARFSTTSDEETPVNETLKKLLAALGLPDTTSEADALAGVAALKAKAGDQETQIAALKAAEPDPAKYVPVATMQALQSEVAALAARLNGDEAARVIGDALAGGQLLPAQKAWAEELAKTNLAALKSYLAATPVNPALAGMQSGGQPRAAGSDNRNDAELAVMKALGLSAEQFAAGKVEA
ncbi:MAG: phage protease [Pseudomonadota bacterium]